MSKEKLLNIYMAGQKIRTSAKKKAKEVVDSPIKEFCPEDKMRSVYREGIEYAWVSSESKQCIPFISCRDYLQCSVWAVHNDSSINSLGLYYDPTTATAPKIDLENLRLAVRFKDVSSLEFKESVDNSLKLINKVEEDMGIPLSKVYYGGKYSESEHDTWVFKGDKSWMRSPYHISMYALLIRVGTKYDGVKTWDQFLGPDNMNYICPKDYGYLHTCRTGMVKIVHDKNQTLFAKLAKDNFPTADKNLDYLLERLHYTGIVEWSNGLVPAMLKVNWRNG